MPGTENVQTGVGSTLFPSQVSVGETAADITPMVGVTPVPGFPGPTVKVSNYADGERCSSLEVSCPWIADDRRKHER